MSKPISFVMAARKAFKARCWTLADLARVTRSPSSSIRNVISDQREPRVGLATKIAAALDLEFRGGSWMPRHFIVGASPDGKSK